MKLFLPFIAFSVALFPLTSLAAVDLKLDREVAPVVVNGEAVGFFLQKKSKLELQNGINQIVVRVEKLVQKNNGEKEKFNSKPVVLTFESSDSFLELSINKEVNSAFQADEFNKAPVFVLKNKSTGQILPSTQEILPHGGGLTRDYEKEVAKYNRKNGIKIDNALTYFNEKSSPSLVTDPTTTEEKVFNNNSQVRETNQDAMSPDNRIIIMQADFLRMSAEDQQKFLNWAVKNVRS